MVEGRSISDIAEEFGIATASCYELRRNLKRWAQLTKRLVAVVHERRLCQKTGIFYYKQEESEDTWQGTKEQRVLPLLEKWTKVIRLLGTINTYH